MSEYKLTVQSTDEAIIKSEAVESLDLTADETIINGLKLEEEKQLKLDSSESELLKLSLDESSMVVKDYNKLINKPSINEVELKGDKSFEELGLLPMSNADIDNLFDLL